MFGSQCTAAACTESGGSAPGLWHGPQTDPSGGTPVTEGSSRWNESPHLVSAPGTMLQDGAGGASPLCWKDSGGAGGSRPHREEDRG